MKGKKTGGFVEIAVDGDPNNIRIDSNHTL